MLGKTNFKFAYCYFNFGPINGSVDPIPIPLSESCNIYRCDAEDDILVWRKALDLSLVVIIIVSQGNSEHFWSPPWPLYGQLFSYWYS